jgi:hypothetical protein
LEYQITQRYLNHYGVDLKNSDLTRGLQFASDMRNAQYKQSGSPEKRRGNQASVSSSGGIGLFEYQRYNPESGLDESEVVCVDTQLRKMKTVTLAVTYSGTALTCTISVYVNTDALEYRCRIDEGASTILDFPLGQGFDEVAPVTITQLAAAINALSNFSAVITGDGSVSAAFIQIVRDWPLTSGPFSGVAKYWEEVFSAVTTPFAAAWAAQNNSDFENVCEVVIQNNIYFSHATIDVLKYDGQMVYKAGLPTPLVPTSALGAAGAITGSNYFHQVQYIQKDNAGQIIEGNITRTDTGVTAAAQKIDVTVPNVLAGSGFNTNCAIVAGAQVAVTTITVDNGSGGANTMRVGDTAYFYDAVSADYVERKVTARNATTITIAGAAVTVADNAVISNNLRIGIYRNKTSAVTPSVYYLVAEVPNNSFTATQAYTDDLSDTNLGAIIFPPAYDRSPPKKGKYISQWSGVMITAAAIDTPSIVAYSSDEGPEYFPNDSNEIIYGTAAGDPIRGIGANNEVFAIMGLNSFGVLSGDIRTNSLRLDIKSEDIGCVAHATIREINGEVAWLSSKGPRVSGGGQVPRPLGEAMDADGRPSSASRIDPIFEQGTGRPPSEMFKLRRAIGVHDRKEDKYLLFIPATSTVAGDVNTNDSSRVFGYDYIRDAWLIWDNLDFMGGAMLTSQTEELYFTENRRSAFLGGPRHITYRRHGLGDAWDYADNLQPVGGTDAAAWEYSSQWEPLGQPSVLKRFTKLKVFTLEETANSSFSIDVIQELNYARDSAVALFSLSFAVPGYGESAYGDAPYGDPAELSAFHPLRRDRTRSTRIRLRNNKIHENVVITGWELEAVTPYRVEIKS